MHDMLIIIGASGHGKVCADIAEHMNRWKEIKFLDDDINNTQILNYEIIGSTTDYILYRDVADFFVAIGDNRIREQIYNKLLNDSCTLISLIHPNSVLGSNIDIGLSSVVMPGAVINTSVKIGAGCIINTLSSIDHDCIIGDFVHISPGVNMAGNVMVGNKTWLGIGSCIINNLEICSESIIGAGAVVIKDIKEPGTYVGIQARRIK